MLKTIKMWLSQPFILIILTKLYSPVLYSFNEIHLDGISLTLCRTAIGQCWRQSKCGCHNSHTDHLDKTIPCSLSFNEIHLNGLQILKRNLQFWSYVLVETLYFDCLNQNEPCSRSFNDNSSIMDWRYCFKTVQFWN